MSEVPVPYGSNNNEVERLARFMDGFLSLETLEGIPAPEGLQKEYDDMSDKEKREWFVYTFHELFKTAALEADGFMGRGLRPSEFGLIRRRILNFFKKLRIEFEE